MASKFCLLASTSLLASLLISAADAQTPQAPPPTDAATPGATAKETTIGSTATSDTVAATGPASDNVKDIVVTGSRIANGFQTPTPVTAASAAELKLAAPGNLADGLNQLPIFNGSTKTQQTTGGGLPGTAGQNTLNLRNLGANRALVLLDGHRVVSTNDSGSVDINVLPQNLVRRVDVVTGGASAAYGSDAVAGVINFILDTKFTGVKGEINGGISTHGDSKSALGDLAFGHQWMDGRLKLIASGQYYRQDGLFGLAGQKTGRKWHDVASGQIPNPVAGATPTVLLVPDLKAALGSYGGLISSGPLRGTQFLANGQSGPFQYGNIVGSTYMSGGDANAGDPGNGLFPDQRRINLFAHTEFDVTDKVTVYAEALYGRANTTIKGALNFGTGAAGQLNIFRDNAYLPADILARMITANVQSIPLGRYYLEFGPTVNESLVRAKRGVIGARGTFLPDWTFDASYSYGQTRQHLAKNNLTILRNLFAASDAVRNTSGQIVCRSTLSGFDPGCVPLNPFGLNSVTPEAARYVLGDSYKDLRLTQNVAALNVSGDFGDRLQLGAGPISIALGGEYRKEQAHQTSDPISQQVVSLTGLRTGVAPTSIAGRLGPFQFYNPQPLDGSYTIKEGYAELGVPLLKDKPFFRMLDLSLAGRHADYSQSGGVNTWKVGGNWEINGDIRLRYTRSRDIRGPNTLELFNSQTQTNQTIVYQGQTTQNVILTSGNPNLRPERATTETYGVVLTPSFLRGFQFSVDRYKIKIRDSIGNFTAQQTADQCALNNQTACGQISVQSNGTLIFRLQPLNLSVEENDGYDFEGAYRTTFGRSSLQLRALVSHINAAFRSSPGVGTVKSLGGPMTPRWRGTFTAQYSLDAFALFVSERFIGKALIDPTKVQGVDVSDNHVPTVWYTNLTGRYRLSMFDGHDQELFISVSNLFNREPPFSGGNPTSYNTPANNAYDTMGRYFTAGVRFSF